MSWFSRLWSKKEAHTSLLEAIEPLPGEVRPPWVEFPGIPPHEFFWREAGEPWRAYIWQTYYSSLSEEEQIAYLKRWQVPEDWYQSVFGKEELEFWEHADDPEEWVESPGIPCHRNLALVPAKIIKETLKPGYVEEDTHAKPLKQ